MSKTPSTILLKLIKGRNIKQNTYGEVGIKNCNEAFRSKNGRIFQIPESRNFHIGLALENTQNA